MTRTLSHFLQPLGPARREAARRSLLAAQAPYLAEWYAGRLDVPPQPPSSVRVATYNVHRWAGVRGGNAWVPDRAAYVVEALNADVIALQEVLVPFDERHPLRDLARALGYHVAFVTTRVHRNGELGNAVLSRWPIEKAEALDLTVGRMERRAALLARIQAGVSITVISTHLALVDRSRKMQVQTLLAHPHAQGAVVLMGDMNAWRRCSAVRSLDEAFDSDHDNAAWPPSFPSPAPVLALDRIYVQRARVAHIERCGLPEARLASDHLPVVATVALPESPPL